MKDPLNRAAFSIAVIISLLLLGPSSSAQKAQLGVHPEQAHSKQPAAKAKSEKSKRKKQKGGGSETSPATTQMTAQSTARIPSNASTQSLTAQSSCDITVLLLMDSVTQLSIHTFAGSPPNATISFTVGQDNAGTVGFCLSQNGPFNSTVVVDVSTDSNGVGTSAPFFTMGLALGETNAIASSIELGDTNLVHLTVIKQCNCPPINVVP